MGTSKKNRGKQRKAQKPNETQKFTDRVDKYRKTIRSLPASTVINSIRGKEAVPTVAVFTLLEHLVRGEAGQQEQVVVTLLNNLVDNTDGGSGGLVQALLDCCVDGCTEGLRGGDEYPALEQTFPSMWVRSLAHTIESICTGSEREMLKLEVACGISPLLESFSNDASRIYFGSNKEWHACLEPFVFVIHFLAQSDDASQILLSNEQVVEFMIHASFFGSNMYPQRKVMVEEAAQITNDADGHFFRISRICMKFMHRALSLYESSKEKMNEIASMAVVRNVRGDNDEVSPPPFILGLIEMIKEYTNKKYEEKQFFYQVLLSVSTVPLEGDSSLDQRVIPALTDLGKNHSKTYEDATANALIISQALDNDEQKWETAIDSGLTEMILGLLVKFGGVNDGKVDKEGHLLSSLEKILVSVESISKSSEALANKREGIVEALEAAASSIPQNDNSQVIYQNLCEIVGHECDQTEEEKDESYTCTSCFVDLEKEKVRRCTKCQTIYCSRDCQVQGKQNLMFRNGHSTPSNRGELIIFVNHVVLVNSVFEVTWNV